MNLHTITPPGVWFWIENRGGNGRTLGVHLYPMARRPRPDINAPRPEWAHRWWIAPYYEWRPYRNSFQDLHPRGIYTPPPLCNRQSTSRQAGASYAHGPNPWVPTCQNCAQIAAERGIMGQFYNLFEANDPEYQTLRREMIEWQEAQMRQT